MKSIRSIFTVAVVLVVLSAMAAVTYVGNMVGDTVTATNLTTYSTFKMRGLWPATTDAKLLVRETNQVNGGVYFGPHILRGTRLFGDFGGDGSYLTNLNSAHFAAGDVVVTNTQTGVSLTGTFTGDGAGLTNLSLSGLSLSNNWVGSFTGNGSGMTNIPLSGLAESPLTNNETRNVVFAGTITGNASGATNIPISALTTIPLTNNETRAVTFSNAVLSGATSALSTPAQNEFPTAGWVRGLFMNGALYYNTTNVYAGATNSDFPNIFQYQSAIPNTSARGYTNTALAAGNYIGTVITTNRFTQVQGPVDVDAYLGFTSAGSPNLTIHPELYYSYDLTNWFGDFSAGNETITLGTTNLYQWAISFPTINSTNAGGFYLARRFKVGASSSLVASSILWVTTGTNAVSGTSSASHIHVPGSDTTTGNAFLNQTQTFTGSNTFTGGVWGKLIPPTKAGFSTNYTALSTDGIMFCTGTNQLITLPLTPQAGSMFTVVASSTTGSAIVTNGNGTMTILGGLSISVPSTNRLTVVFDGTNYW